MKAGSIPDSATHKGNNMLTIDDYEIQQKVSKLVDKHMKPDTKTLKKDLKDLVKVKGKRVVDKAVVITAKKVYEDIKRKKLNVTYKEVMEWVRSEYEEYWVRQLVIPYSGDYGL